MPRVSRKKIYQKVTEKGAVTKIWNTAIYARISKYNAGKEDSETLETQIEFLKQNVFKHADWNLIDVYADNGFTGTNFNRPEFERMLSDIQSKKIDCVIVKDLSRFGRNYIEAGYYMENLFPSLGIRFVAVNDHYDSANEKGNQGMMVPIKDLLNACYSKDLSKKVRTALEKKREYGENCSVVPYGYKKSEENKGKLILDEEVSDYVRLIFEWKNAGKGNTEIAELLNIYDAPFPHKRRKQLGLVKTQGRVTRDVWNNEDVAKIIENPVYTGDMVYNRFQYKNGFKGGASDNDRSEWQIVPNSHPAIISWELYDAVFEKRMATRARIINRKMEITEKTKEKKNIFQEKVFCMNCGKKMYLRNIDRNMQSDFYYYSCTYHGCKNHGWIAEPLLRILVTEQIKRQLDLIGQREIFNSQAIVIEKKKQHIKEQAEKQKEIENELLKVKVRKNKFYEEYVEGVISVEDYKLLCGKLLNKEETLQKQISACSKEIKRVEELFQKNETAKGKTKNVVNLSKRIVDEFIQKVEIGKHYECSITFKFRDQAECLEEMKEVILK